MSPVTQRRRTRPGVGWLAGLLLLAGCSPEPFPEEYRTDRQAFIEAVTMIEEAGVLLQQSQNGELPVEVAVNHLEQGMFTGYRVRESFLDYVHPQLNGVYNNELLPGAEAYIQGVREGDIDAQSEGIRKVGQWMRFWEANRAEILERLQIDRANPV
jgi:hypothetical protein